MEKEDKGKINIWQIFFVIALLIISFLSFKKGFNIWKDYDTSYFREIKDPPTFYVLLMVVLGMFFLWIAFSAIREIRNPKIETEEKEKIMHNFYSFPVIRPYSPKLLKTQSKSVMVFDSNQKKILIGKEDSPINTFTKIPYKCVLDYEIVSDETVLYKPTLGGVIMWGAAATKKKKATINNVTIKIYASNIQNTILFPIITNENINQNTSEFNNLQSELDKFVREMKIIEKRK
ncbi:hypothetical protein [Enterococcus sp. N249-2]